MSDRLFVPLNTEPFEWFRDDDKTWEVRSVDHNFNRQTVYIGRPVELRKGYATDESIWGTIANVRTNRRLTPLVRQIGYENISPVVNNEYEAVARLNKLLGGSREYIAFEVNFDDRR